MGKLLNPKVVSRYYQYLTYPEYQKFLKALKSKKMGFKDVALEVEEVTVEKEIVVDTNFAQPPKIFQAGPHHWADKSGDVRHRQHVEPGTYYHVRLEYIV